MVSRVIPVEPFDLVVFGATGDLAQRKILPALFHRFCAGQIPADTQIIGAARSELTTAQYRQKLGQALKHQVSDPICDDKSLHDFLQLITYVPLDGQGETGWPLLCDRLAGAGSDRG